jgi:hypothetical protein
MSALACSSGATPIRTAPGDDAGEVDDSAAPPAPSGATSTPVVDGDAGGDGGQAAASPIVAEAGSGHDASPPEVTCRPALPAVTSMTQYLCDPGGAGKCNDCGDCAMVIDGTASSQVASCGTSCIGQPESCVTTCLSGKTPTLSNPCQTCLVALFDCTTTYCAGPCVTGTKAQCGQCLASNPTPGSMSCNSVFLRCAGLTNNPSYAGQ